MMCFMITTKLRRRSPVGIAAGRGWLQFGDEISGRSRGEIRGKIFAKLSGVDLKNQYTETSKLRIPYSERISYQNDLVNL